MGCSQHHGVCAAKPRWTRTMWTRLRWTRLRWTLTWFPGRKIWTGVGFCLSLSPAPVNNKRERPASVASVNTVRPGLLLRAALRAACSLVLLALCCLLSSAAVLSTAVHAFPPLIWTNLPSREERPMNKIS